MPFPERSDVDVFTNDHLGVWPISWMDQVHDTGFHDHDASAGGVYVVQGAIRHEQLRLGAAPVRRTVRAREGFCFDKTFIHRMRQEPGSGPTVTIHAYSPRLEWTGHYRELEDGLLHRTATPSVEQLGPHGRQGQGRDPTG